MLACAQATEPQTTTKSRRSNRAPSDKKFFTEAAQGGMAEVELGQLAEKNGSASCVKQFGQRMATDHGKMNDDAKSLASQKSVTLPSQTSAHYQQVYKELSQKTGSDFDKAYIQTMLKDHTKDIAEFRHEANSGTDPEIKDWASKAIPTLQEHLRLAQDCAKQLGISTSPTGE